MIAAIDELSKFQSNCSSFVCCEVDKSFIIVLDLSVLRQHRIVKVLNNTNLLLFTCSICNVRGSLRTKNTRLDQY
jgi:hypothetical protein